MPLTKIKSLGITDGTITGDDINSTFNLTGKTVTLPAGTGGKVLQVVSATDSTARTTTSASYVTASNTLSVTITPSATANKILILVSTAIVSGGDNQGFFTIYRNSTNLTGANGFAYARDGNVNATYNLGINYLDSPSTTSSTTYQLYLKSDAGQSTIVNRNNVTGSITVLEIAG